MYTWLMPWLYVGVVGFLYFVVGKSRQETQEWLKQHTNTWLAIALVFAVVGVAGVIFWRARWLHLLSWLAWLAVVIWTLVAARRGMVENRETGFPPEESDF